MGTSKPRRRPRGDRWDVETGTLPKLSTWRPDQHNAEPRLEKIADQYVQALQDTVREDPTAFGLCEAASAAGDRLADAMEAFAGAAPVSPEEFLTRLATEVGGPGVSLTDAILRRAATRAGVRILDLRPDVRDALRGGAPGPGLDARGLASDLLCLLFRLFFADLVGEFLRAIFAEELSSELTVLDAVNAEDRIADHASERVLKLLPDPCEEAQGPVLQTARRLVPRSVDRALGLLTDDEGGDASDAGEAAAA